jgi:hypothetical protein
VEYNELNKSAMGGTELMAHRIEDVLGPDLLSQVQIIHSRARELDESKKKIYVLHDLPGDPEVQHLKDGGWKRYDKLVFVSHWQKQMYEVCLGIPPSVGTVIHNAIDPIPYHTKPTDKIRLFYHSTPHRGLNILYPVFAKLYEEFGDDIELKVFSSFGLYGWPQRDKPYEDLFKALEDHPGIDYNKAVDNATVRQELTKAHIFAYPSIWQETSCLCLMEAMSAGLTPVHSSLAALPETSMGLSLMYDYNEDLSLHANVFYAMLRNTIKEQASDGTKAANDFRKIAIDAKHSLSVLESRWNTLVKDLIR